MTILFLFLLAYGLLVTCHANCVDNDAFCENGSECDQDTGLCYCDNSGYTGDSCGDLCTSSTDGVKLADMVDLNQVMSDMDLSFGSFIYSFDTFSIQNDRNGLPFPSCHAYREGNSAPAMVFFLDMPAMSTLLIGQTYNNFDSLHALYVGYNDCAANSVLQGCLDDDDYESFAYVNGSPYETQRIYFLVGGYANSYGSGELGWTLESLIEDCPNDHSCNAQGDEEALCVLYEQTYPLCTCSAGYVSSNSVCELISNDDDETTASGICELDEPYIQIPDNLGYTVFNIDNTAPLSSYCENITMEIYARMIHVEFITSYFTTMIVDLLDTRHTENFTVVDISGSTLNCSNFCSIWNDDTLALAMAGDIDWLDTSEDGFSSSSSSYSSYSSPWTFSYFTDSYYDYNSDDYGTVYPNGSQLLVLIKGNLSVFDSGVGTNFVVQQVLNPPFCELSTDVSGADFDADNQVTLQLPYIQLVDFIESTQYVEYYDEYEFYVYESFSFPFTIQVCPGCRIQLLTTSLHQQVPDGSFYVVLVDEPCQDLFSYWGQYIYDYQILDVSKGDDATHEVTYTNLEPSEETLVFMVAYEREYWDNTMTETDRRNEEVTFEWILTQVCQAVSIAVTVAEGDTVELVLGSNTNVGGVSAIMSPGEQTVDVCLYGGDYVVELRDHAGIDITSTRLAAISVTDVTSGEIVETIDGEFSVDHSDFPIPKSEIFCPPDSPCDINSVSFPMCASEAVSRGHDCDFNAFESTFCSCSFGNSDCSCINEPAPGGYDSLIIGIVLLVLFLALSVVIRTKCFSWYTQLLTLLTKNFLILKRRYILTLLYVFSTCLTMVLMKLLVSNIDIPGIPHREFMASWLPPFMGIALTINLSCVLQLVVYENEKGLLKMMRKIGMSEGPYWLSWFIALGFLSVLSALLTPPFGYMLQIFFFEYTTYLIQVFLALFLQLAVLANALFLAALMKTMKNSSILVFVYFVYISLSMTIVMLVGGVYNVDQVISPPTANSSGFDGLIYALAPWMHWLRIESDIVRHQFMFPATRDMMRAAETSLLYEDLGGFYDDWSSSTTAYWSDALPNYAYSYYRYQSPEHTKPAVYSWDDIFIPMCDTGRNATEYFICRDVGSHTGDSFYMMLLIAVLFMLLTWYAAHLRDSKGWFFFVSLEYWDYFGIESWRQEQIRRRQASFVAGDGFAEAAERSRLDSSIIVMKLTKAYRNTTAVKEVSFDVQPGMMTALLGHNGAGKTSLLHTLQGDFPPTHGRAFILGHDVATEMYAIKKLVGTCHQDDIVWDHLTAREHMNIVLSFKGMHGTEREDHIEKHLRLFELATLNNVPASAYSGGMLRRLSACMATCGNPRVVYLDEPTTGMDVIYKRKMWNVFQELSTTPCIGPNEEELPPPCIIVTSHSMEEADVLGENIIMMSNGKIRANGSPSYLKGSFGLGHQILLLVRFPECIPRIMDAVHIILPGAQRLESASDDVGELIICLPQSNKEYVGVFFAWLDRLLKACEESVYGTVITKWSFSNSTLEELFLRLCQVEKGVNTVLTNHAEENDKPCQLCRNNKSDGVKMWSANTKGARAVNVSGYICGACALADMNNHGDVKVDEESNKQRLEPAWVLDIIGVTSVADVKLQNISSSDVQEDFVAASAVPSSSSSSSERKDDIPGIRVHVQPSSSSNDASSAAPDETVTSALRAQDAMGRREKLTKASLYYHQIVALAVKDVASFLKHKWLNRFRFVAIIITIGLLAGIPGFPQGGGQPLLNQTGPGLVILNEETQWTTGGEFLVDYETSEFAFYNEYSDSQLTFFLTSYDNSDVDMSCYYEDYYDYAGGVGGTDEIEIATIWDPQVGWYYCVVSAFTAGEWQVQAVTVISQTTGQHSREVIGYPDGQFFDVDDGALNWYSVMGVSAHVAMFMLILCMLVPVVLRELTYERTSKNIRMLQVAGLQLVPYVLGHYFVYFAACFILSIIVVLVGYLASASVFIHSSFLCWIGLMFLSNLVVVPFFMFLSVFMPSPRVADILGWLTVLLFSQSILFVNLLWPYPLSFWTGALPLVTIGRGVTLLMIYGGDEIPFNTELSYTLLTMFAWSIIYLLATYLAFGLRYYDFAQMFKQVLGKGCCTLRSGSQIVASSHEVPTDVDVACENDRIAHETRLEEDNRAITLQNVHKTFFGAKNKMAVKNLTLGVEYGDAFGLLGSNGAGKTSLIKMLTGWMSPTSCDRIEICGYNVIQDRASVYQDMGTCPQFDVVFPDLTVEEHLRCYALIKGTPWNAVNAVAYQAAHGVALDGDSFRSTASSLSGGQKRRLSIAISLLGTPRVWILDEPTTGLDPDVRRDIMTVIMEIRKRRVNNREGAIVLCTHDLHEAMAVCNRMGIMHKGELVALGNAEHLKLRHGSGYSLTLNIDPSQAPQIDEKALYARIDQFVLTHISVDATKSQAFGKTRTYKLPTANIVMTDLFTAMEEQSKGLCIRDWELSPATLEDVFHHVVTDFDETMAHEVELKQFTGSMPRSADDYEQKSSRDDMKQMGADIEMQALRPSQADIVSVDVEEEGMTDPSTTAIIR